MKSRRRIGNWTPEGLAEHAALRRDYTELTPSSEWSRSSSYLDSRPNWLRPGVVSAVPELDIRGILEALTREGVEFLIIGGVAVGFHGYPGREGSFQAHLIQWRSRRAATGCCAHDSEDLLDLQRLREARGES